MLAKLITEFANSPLREGLQWFTREKLWINEQHLQVCRIPAPTFFEQRRSEWMLAQFRALGCVARIDRAGCYTALIPPVRGSRGRYYVEWFEVADDTSPVQLRERFERRADVHSELELNVVALPMGSMAPRSLGFAAWGLPTFGAAEALVGSAADLGPLAAVVDASLYADLGREQL